MTRTLVRLEEWEPDHRVPDLRLREEDRALARALSEGEGRLRVTELADGVSFGSSAWVGVVRFSEVEVRIAPKLVGDSLGVLEMLEYSSGLSALARLESARTLASDRDGSLVDLLALLLAEGAISIAKRGILQDYVTREEALPRLRGRLLPFEQAVHQYGQLALVECRFDEFESDVPENQVLAAGLAIAKRVATDPEARRLAARAHAIFSEAANAAAARALPPAFDCNRRNEHYRPSHTIARLFLDNLAVADLYSPGSSDSFAFLLDMNKLFEDFVTKLLIDAFRDSDVAVRVQRRDRTLIKDARTDKPYAAVIPDILLESRQPLRQVPVDAKYKLYDDRKIDQSDIYQTFFYAWAYANPEDASDAPAFILYPGRASSPGTHLRAQARAGDRAASIQAIPLDVPILLEQLSRGGPIEVPVARLSAGLR